MPIRSTTKFFMGFLGGLLGGLLFVGTALAQLSFNGKTIHIIISSRAGGGTDRTARLIGRFLPKYLPGNPQVVFRNMPGGDGITAANYFATKTKRNGLTLLQAHSTMISPLLLKRDVVKYDPRKFELITAINRGGSVIVVRKDAHKRLTDSSATPVIVGALSGTRTWNAMIVWGAEFLGWNVKWVTGYPGTDALTTALLQGEVEMTATSNAFILRGLREEGVVDLIAQIGISSGDRHIRRSAFPDVPAFPELLLPKKLKKVEWEAYLSWTGSSQVDKWLSLPPGTDEKYVQAYRRAVDQVTKDPKFIRGAKNQLSEDVVPIPGEEFEKLLNEVVGVSDEALTYAAKLRKKYGLPQQ